MNNNKMAEVAKMFGKKMGEEFTVIGKYKNKMTCMFSMRGLMYLDTNFFDWQQSGDYLFQDLLTGKAVIVDE
jgi:hypothetical protein